MPNPTNYSKSSPNASEYSDVNLSTDNLLLEDGTDFLLEDSNTLLLEESEKKPTNYAKSSPNATNYS